MAKRYQHRIHKMIQIDNKARNERCASESPMSFFTYFEK